MEGVSDGSGQALQQSASCLIDDIVPPSPVQSAVPASAPHGVNAMLSSSAMPSGVAQGSTSLDGAAGARDGTSHHTGSESLLAESYSASGAAAPDLHQSPAAPSRSAAARPGVVTRAARVAASLLPLPPLNRPFVNPSRRQPHIVDAHFPARRAVSRRLSPALVTSARHPLWHRPGRGGRSRNP